MSLDRGHPSMVKIASLGRKKALWIGRAFPERRKELQELAFRQGVQEGLEQNDGFPQTGIQIVMRSIENFPMRVAIQGVPREDLLQRSEKIGGEFVHEFAQCGDFVQELRPPGKKYLAENTVESRHTLAAGVLKILGIKRSKVRRGAEMPRMEMHGVEQAVQGHS